MKALRKENKKAKRKAKKKLKKAKKAPLEKEKEIEQSSQLLNNEPNESNQPSDNESRFHNKPTEEIQKLTNDAGDSDATTLDDPIYNSANNFDENDHFDKITQLHETARAASGQINPKPGGKTPRGPISGVISTFIESPNTPGVVTTESIPIAKEWPRRYENYTLRESPKQFVPHNEVPLKIKKR